jgi:hypothetical protein
VAGNRRHIATLKLTSSVLLQGLSRTYYSLSIYYDLNAKDKVGRHSTVLFAVVVTLRVHFSKLGMFFDTFI